MPDEVSEMMSDRSWRSFLFSVLRRFSLKNEVSKGSQLKNDEKLVQIQPFIAIQKNYF